MRDEIVHPFTAAHDGFLRVSFDRKGDSGLITFADGGGGGDGDEARRELIERSLRGEHIELILSAVTYQQQDGKPNRNYIEFSPSALKNLARTGPNTPFLQDHRLWDSNASGGFAVSSKVDIGEDGLRNLVEDIKLVTPAAVRAALDGRMRKFSIGIEPVGRAADTLECTACNGSVRDCQHWPGEILEVKGVERVVTWRYKAARMIERSWVLYPAVEETHATGWRELAARWMPMSMPMPIDKSADDKAKSEHAPAAEHQALQAKVADLTAQLAAVTEENVKLKAERDEARAQADQAKLQSEVAEVEQQVRELCASGKLLPQGAQERQIRERLAAKDLAGAKTLLGFAAQGEPVSHAGAARQSAGTQTIPLNGGKVDFDNLIRSLPEYETLAARFKSGKGAEAYIRANKAHVCKTLGLPDNAF